MKKPLTIGIVGGMSPESTATYYQYIVRRHQAEFHNHCYPRIIIASVSFQQYIEWQHRGDWGSIAQGLEEEFKAVALAGANFAILATNTMHKILPTIRCSIPILSVFEAVASHAKKRGFKRIGLTGTKFTMSDGFYKNRLEQFGLSVCLPSQEEQEQFTISSIMNLSREGSALTLSQRLPGFWIISYPGELKRSSWVAQSWKC